MLKLIAFDIDGTISDHDAPISINTIKGLRTLEEKGIQLAFISGKPADYVAGTIRQLGLNNAIISGENGAIIYFNQNYPIRKEVIFQNPDKEILDNYKEYILSNFADSIWVQPNRVNFSFFIKNGDIKNEIFEFTINHFHPSNFEYYFHGDDCIDVIYKGIHKGWALNMIQKELGIKFSQTATVGDGVNDFPMFKESYYSIGVNRAETLLSVKNIDEALEAVCIILESKKECIHCGHKRILSWYVKENKRVLGECDKCEHTTDLYQFEENKFYNPAITKS
jgi:HAD superfamily hydrolase (TIGR01484 family)